MTFERDTDLAEKVITLSMQWSGTTRLWPEITEEMVRTLISIAYFASSLPEEGRFPTCSIAIVPPNSHCTELVKFSDPEELSIESLRRYAPTCDEKDHGLVLRPIGGRLLITGLTTFHHIAANIELGSPETTDDVGVFGFQVDILGPAHLRASFGKPAWELQGGTVRSTFPRFFVHPSLHLLHELEPLVTESCLSGIEGEERERAQKLFGGIEHVGRLLGSMLFDRVLRRMIKSRHGGSVVIVPRPEDLQNSDLFSPVSLRRVNDLSLKVSMSHYLRACIDFNLDENPGAREYAAHRQLRYRAEMYAVAEAISSLSAVDGAVVLDRSFTVLAFGARIAASGTSEKPSNVRFYDVDDKLLERPFPTDTVLASAGGTRHQSVCRLVLQNPGTVAYVISQDGKLTIVWSAVNRACIDGPVSYGWD